MKKKQKTKPKVFAGILLAIGLIVSGGLFALSYATAETILPGVAINGIPVSGLRAEAARSLAVRMLSDRPITLRYQGHAWTVATTDLGIHYDLDAAVDSALRQGRNVVSFADGGNVVAPIFVERQQLAQYIAQLEAEVLAAPINATFVYENQGFSILPERAGLTFDVDAALEQLVAHETTVTLKAKTATPKISALSLRPLLERAQQVAAQSLTLSIEKTTIQVPSDVLKSWITADADQGIHVALNEAKVGAYVQEATKHLAKQPEPQKVIQSEQRTEVMSEGKVGKQLVLADAVAAVSAHVLTSTAGPLTLTLAEVPRPIEYATAPAAPVATGKAIGIDLTQQHGYVYQDGRLVYSMKISSGLNDWTPTGTFKVYAKTKKQKMSGPGYYVPNVPNILWFQGDYSMHGVYWHNDFGIRPRSHGCVGQSVEDSEWTYNFGEVGMPIVIYKS